MIHVPPLLVVDDDPDFRELVCNALSDQGYCALGAASGAVALKVLETVAPALAIVDVNMPAMSGPEFVREAQARVGLDPQRVVMVSSHGVDCSSIARWRLMKPLDFGLMLRIVEDFCGTGAHKALWMRT